MHQSISASSRPTHTMVHDLSATGIALSSRWHFSSHLQRYVICARTIALMLWLAMLSGCQRQDTPSQGPQYSPTVARDTPTYRMAIHPLHNPRKLTESYQPLIDLLNQSIPNVRFVLEASRDYQTYEAKFRAREAEILLPNPWQTIEAMKAGYAVIAIAGNDEDFKGIFLVRKDSPIRSPADLKGKAVSYPSPTALAASMLPQQFLHDQGLDVRRDIDNRYVGSQESSIMNVALGQTVAGATWPPPWRAFQKDHPTEAAQLRIIWETAPLINNSVMVRDDVPAVVRDQVRKVLLDLDRSASGRAILEQMETARFRDAGNSDYDKVRDFIARFEKNVRPVEIKQ